MTERISDVNSNCGKIPSIAQAIGNRYNREAFDCGEDAFNSSYGAVPLLGAPLTLLPLGTVEPIGGRRLWCGGGVMIELV